MSRTHRSRGAAAVVLVALILAGCSSGPTFTRSEIGTGPDGLRTFTWPSESDGGHRLCTLGAAVHPVSGVLRGDRDDSQEPVWLEGHAGTRLSIVWPAGFTVSFEPEAVLRDEAGTVAARAGTIVDLGQVDAMLHAGTFGDPYIAAGLLFDGCYPFSG